MDPLVVVSQWSLRLVNNKRLQYPEYDDLLVVIILVVNSEKVYKVTELSKAKETLAPNAGWGSSKGSWTAGFYVPLFTWVPWVYSRWPLIPYKSCCLIENLIFQFKTNLLDTLFSIKTMCLFTAASMKISLKNCFCKTILHYDHTAESEKTK